MHLSAERPVELLEPFDFTSLAVVRDDGVDPDRLAALGRVEGAHVFLDRGVLLALGPSDDPQWVAGIGAMIESVRRFGWVDHTGAVRAHVETPDGG